MLRVVGYLGQQSEMVKLFKLLKVVKGSAHSALSPAQKVKLVKSKLVRAGKFRDFGNNVSGKPSRLLCLI
jgi:hypothetical protein